MDNVLNIEKCKFCSGVISIDKSSSALVKVCTCCGYFYSQEHHNNNYEDKVEENNTNSNIIEYLNPCGAYKLVTFSGIGQVGTLGEGLTEEEVLKKFNFSDTSRLNMDKTYISFKDPVTKELKVIFGQGKPESYEEFIGKK